MTLNKMSSFKDQLYFLSNTTKSLDVSKGILISILLTSLTSYKLPITPSRGKLAYNHFPGPNFSFQMKKFQKSSPYDILLFQPKDLVGILLPINHFEAS